MNYTPSLLTPLVSLRAVDCVLGGVAVLHGLDCTLHAGERIALVGPNGCGKSTLLRLLHGLLLPTRGTLHTAQPLRQAMLFQRPHMLNTSVRKHVALGLWAQGLSWKHAQAQAQTVLAQVGLAHSAAQSARTLSGGQQQRLSLARAWAMQPDMLLLDEPTASLDPQAKTEVEHLIEAWAAGAAARTLVFASHNLGQVKRLASRVIYLERGRIAADLPAPHFFNAPLHTTHPQAHAFLKGERI